jgi:hypothetical protein
LWISFLPGGAVVAALRLDQIVPEQQFGDENLGGLEVEAPHLHHDIKDVVGFAALAGAEGAILLAVPTPGRVIVDVIRIRALDMRPTLAPRDTERVENIGLAAAGGADRLRGDKAGVVVGGQGLAGG